MPWRVTPSKRRIVESDVLAATTGFAGQPEKSKFFFMKVIDVASHSPHCGASSNFGVKMSKGRNT